MSTGIQCSTCENQDATHVTTTGSYCVSCMIASKSPAKP